MQKHALRVAMEELEGIPIVRASGDLDLASVPELREVVNQITERQPQSIVFDFGAITYLDSSGLGVLVSAKRRLGAYGGDVIVIADQTCVTKALSLSGLDKIIRVFRNETEFRRHLRRPSGNGAPTNGPAAEFAERA